MNWSQAVADLSAEDKAFVIVTIIDIEGSSPRNIGTKMIVCPDQIYDTVGGGNLEFEAIAKSRKLLANGTACIKTEIFTLGKDLTQCCGGKVTLLFECIASHNFNITVFGAGHVGKALSKILREIPCKLTYFDSRPEVIDEIQKTESGHNINFHILQNPAIEIEQHAPDTYFLVMTHSHELDMEIVEAILSKKIFNFCGLIGSRSKSIKFRNRLIRKQFNEDEVGRLTCPIGLEGLEGKSPMEVAVSVVAQLIQLNQQNKASNLINELPDNGEHDNLVEISGEG
jgi:xanthine dehydrogenase accessory factor